MNEFPYANKKITKKNRIYSYGIIKSTVPKQEQGKILGIKTLPKYFFIIKV